MLLKNQQKKIISNFLIIFNKDIIKKIYLRYYELEIKVLKKITYYFFDFLKNHSLSLFKILVDIAVIDYPKHNYRFSLIYNFLSLKYNFRLKVIFKVLNFSSIFSSSKLFKGSI
jgi:NADH:ubiquinone oxidoreductase subunit C